MSDVSAFGQKTLEGSCLCIQWPYELLVFNAIWKEESNAVLPTLQILFTCNNLQERVKKSQLKWCF